MGVMVEIHHTEAGRRSEIIAVIEHVLDGREGDWHISILGSPTAVQWEMIITGPNGFERTYSLDGAAGEHEAQAIGQIVSRMIART